MGKKFSKLSQSSSNDNENELERSNVPKPFKYVDGKRYHNVTSLRYHLPNDGDEFDRLQMQHYLSRYIWQSNFSAPVHELLRNGGEDIRVLDVGCGPGTWILEMSSDYPQTGMFHGIDIAPIFPDTIKPFNATFSIQNALEGLNFPDNHFDYVYMRFLTAAFSTEQWETIVIPELVRVTKNGGYIEIMEWDVKIYGQGPIAKRLMDSFLSDLRSRGINDYIVEVIPEFMEKINQLTNIEHETCVNPQGLYGGQLGKLALDNGISIFRTYKPKFSKEYNMTSDEYDKLIEDFIKEMDIYKPHNITHRFWAKKI
ncbi:uncharacterized protein OCT59_028092 [Rhizophagus irregularis]|uniref:Methyltransferase domain-containing protein n=2 Tax=Rhizophagus irregularis TaxID=588596 RepID=A0A915ZR46_9GLOM|nr:hypothetical protein RirG_055750 [Rhizophagus irregularis DAOM 197198w]UZO07819.1 hypothetical protein OCT59_028092 [Rhizophagus irregularis]GBC43217.2 S-adenosyl-L-methionine-dependent methyltransferase [Rhizophagus irregularis DAOM 181602=DAOM 197198]CAB4473323.1 unnamed protein product [Rhizophagus irregularis]CAB5152324.1 unnamed protein product [Rhizophagus irregularis]